MSIVYDGIFVLLLVSLILVIFRLVRGPTLPDRAVAGDQIAIHVVALVAVYSIAQNNPILVDLVIVTAIVGFLSVAVIGIYIERAARGKIRGRSGE